MNTFLKAAGREATLAFVGEEINAYARALQQRWRRRDRGAALPRVMFLEKLDPAAIAAAYCAADVFLYTSRLDVQPLVLLDAMAAGTPFLSTDVGCVREFPGGLVAPGLRPLAGALRRLLADDALRSTLSEAGLAASRRYYNWPCVLDRYEQLLGRLCDS